LTILESVDVNSVGTPVPAGSPYAVAKKAVRWMCDGCGHGDVVSDAGVWQCRCSCHDGWKLGQDGGRFRAQLETDRAGVDLRSAGNADRSVD
jgi:hypothetical protein